MKKYSFIIAAAGLMTLAACSDNTFIEESTPQVPETPTELPTMAYLKGELMVKFQSTATEQVETRTRSTRAGRSGVSAFDEVLETIGAYKFERVFPIDARSEERTREAGMHNWYVIQFDADFSVKEAYALLSTLEGVDKLQYSHTITRGYEPRKSTVVSESALKTMSTRNGSFNDPLLGQQWHCINNGDLENAVAGADIGAAAAWEKCTGDASIIVAVLDEGVMYDHEDLAANMWVNEGEIFGSKEDNDGNGYAGDLHGYNFVFDHGTITYNDARDTGHGTHVAGTIAAVNNNGRGVSSIAGGDGSGNGVKIMSCQVFSGDYGVSLYNEARAIKYAADNGAVILQCSWGYNSAKANPLYYPLGPANDEQWMRSFPLEKDALDYFINNAGSPNGVIDGGLAIFAAGNEGAPQSSYPAAYGEIIGVGSLDAAGMPSSFTNYGLVNLSAPGGDSGFHSSESGKILSTIPVRGQSGYGYMEGTSMACPNASGIAALGLSYAVQQRKHFKASEFRDLLYKSCVPVENYFTESKYYWEAWDLFGQTTLIEMQPKAYTNMMGHGMLNAAALLNNIDNGAGSDMKVPNMYVAPDGTTKIDFARYFLNGENLTYTFSSENNSIASVAVNGTIATITGHQVGMVNATVTTSTGVSQTIVITVRKNANDNGWLR